MHLTVVLGTARKERNSERVYLALLKAFGTMNDIMVEGVDVREHVEVPETIPNWGLGGADEHPTPWKDIVGRTDTFVFILPEYNHGYPGEWKILVDSLFKEYSGKRAFIVGVSGGTFSGVRVADHVKPILVELNFHVEKTALYVGKVKESVNEMGTVVDEKLEERIEKFVDQVVNTS